MRAEAESQNANAIREHVLLGVDVDYSSVLQAQSVMGVAKQTLDMRQLLLDEVTLQASNKLKSEIDVSFARLALENPKTISTPRSPLCPPCLASANFTASISWNNRCRDPSIRTTSPP